MKKYFNVSYHYITVCGKTGFGEISFPITDFYPSRLKLYEIIKDYDNNIESSVIISVTELSEKQFHCWQK